MSPDQAVFVVDDDAAVRDSMRWLMDSVGLRVEAFDSGEAFLRAITPESSGCVVLDLRMPGLGGLDVHAQLRERGINLPVIVVSGHGDVPIAVRALKSGVADFVEKPFKDQELLDCVQQALRRDAEQSLQRLRREELMTRYRALTPRELDVLRLVVAGQANKAIGSSLGISQKTVETHRARVMEKMAARSVSELVRMTLIIESQGKPLPI
ncbi:MAG: response regulator [Gammaproteobacteria bacterium]|jgi:FixJ family two-component response regulator|nr:response regulator [Gammaproteobacteria bacterium]